MQELEFGPLVLRVTPAKLGTHGRITTGPETGEILGDLNGPMVRREDFNDNGLPAVTDFR